MPRKKTNTKTNKTKRASKTARATRRPSKTKLEKLYGVLRDHKWHSTQELVRRVGHTFAASKWRLVSYGYAVEMRRHPRKRYQWQYRLSNGQTNG